MSHLDEKIEDIVRGDTYNLVREVGNVPEGQTLTEAWFTIKEDYWDTVVVISKHITPITSDDGAIEDEGSTGTAIVRFRLESSDTLIFHEYFEYVYDIQVKTSSGAVYSPEYGLLIAHPSVTEDS